MRAFYIQILLVPMLLTLSVMQGELWINPEPTTVIEGPKSQLNRCEGVAFTPDGSYIALGNYLSHSITFYKRIGDIGSEYEIVPSYVLQDNHYLYTIHDLNFSSEGQFLAASSRDSDSAVIFQRLNSEDIQFKTNPVWSVRGGESGIKKCDSIAFSPDDQLIAVLSRMGGTGITFYERFEQKGSFKKTPTQQITEAMLLQQDISAPHGLTFSPDGKLLAVVHSRFRGQAEGFSALAIFEKSDNINELFNPLPVFVDYSGSTWFHSVAFHPSGQYLGVTVAKKNSRVLIYEKSPNSNDFHLYKTFTIDSSGSVSLKGIAFSSSGESLVVTTEPKAYVFEVDFIESH